MNEWVKHPDSQQTEGIKYKIFVLLKRKIDKAVVYMSLHKILKIALKVKPRDAMHFFFSLYKTWLYLISVQHYKQVRETC